MHTARFQNILDHLVDGRIIQGVSFALKKGEACWSGTSGNISSDKPFFIASVTKLFTTAVVLQLIANGSLNLTDRIDLFFDKTELDNLHNLRGTDYSRKITVGNLLSHTSGLPDYFTVRNRADLSIKDKLVKGVDVSFSFSDILRISKCHLPSFAPGTAGKALYSDTNFHLLGQIIERVTSSTYAENLFTRLISPLRLQSTYPYTDPTDTTPVNALYKKDVLRIPKAMVSTGADGCIVSTSDDLLLFAEAFFSGILFQGFELQQLYQWNRIHFPFLVGLGVQQFKLPWYMNPFGGVPSFVGHAGLTGSVLFFNPQQNIYISGTVNQISRPDLAVRTVLKLSHTILV